MNGRLKEALRRFFPRSLVPHRILAGPLRASTIVTSWHDYPAAILGRTERPLLECFANNVGKGETWLDIGAHYGYTAIALSKLVGTSGHVYAFEPMLNTAGCICRTKSMNNLVAADRHSNGAGELRGLIHRKSALDKGNDRQHSARCRRI